MITFARYRQFLAELSSHGIHSLSVDRILARREFKGILCIKHDVESKVSLALKTAEIEHELGHSTTYYFQGSLLSQHQVADMVGYIAELGHEVAYHYDVLDACDGDFDAAFREFDRYKTILEEACGRQITTVCPHGNPTKVRDGWKSNKDFFRSDIVRQRYPDISDIVVDFERLLPNGLYISDAGFQLRKIEDITGNDVSNITAISDGISIDWSNMRRIVSENDGVLLSIHTHRLRKNKLALLILRARLSALRSVYLALKRIPFLESFIGKFYSLTRYI
jgi:hypothetical protein